LLSFHVTGSNRTAGMMLPANWLRVKPDPEARVVSGSKMRFSLLKSPLRMARLGTLTRKLLKEVRWKPS